MRYSSAAGQVRTLRTLLVVLAASALLHCGGGGDDDGGAPSPSPNPTPAPAQACAVSPQELAVRRMADRPLSSKQLSPLHNRPSNKLGALYEELWKHRAAENRVRTSEIRPRATVEESGQVAIVRDAGDVVLSPNLYDLRDVALRFSPNAQGGYDVARSGRAFEPSVGSRLSLGDDDSAALDLPFSFPYYADRYGRVHVNSDGNLTFTEPDTASTDRNVSRFLTGPPRVAVLFADLDPSAAGGVYARADGSGLLVSWCDVPQFGMLGRRANVQARLSPDGSVELVYAARVDVRDAVVGVSPGTTGIFAPVDLSSGSGGSAGAVGERFASGRDIDFVALSRAFYASRPDDYEQMVVWTNVLTTLDAFAYEFSVANDVGGIGLPVFDASAEFGSGGRLDSMVYMDLLGKYPEDPRQRFFGENTALSILAHESGHRWLAFLEFRDGANNSTELLGRDDSHWSFFHDTDASHMEGNDIGEVGDGAFRTTGAVTRYSPLDQYAMGLRAAAEVPPFFFVSGAQSTASAESAPQVGVDIRGTRREVTIQDVIAAMGPRTPDAASAPRTFRQVFVYVLERGTTERQQDLEKLERIRTEWEPFFNASTEGRGTIVARLR